MELRPALDQCNGRRFLGEPLEAVVAAVLAHELERFTDSLQRRRRRLIDIAIPIAVGEILDHQVMTSKNVQSLSHIAKCHEMHPLFTNKECPHDAGIISGIDEGVDAGDKFRLCFV